MLPAKRNAVVYGAGGALRSAVSQAFAREGPRSFGRLSNVRQRATDAHSLLRLLSSAVSPWRFSDPTFVEANDLQVSRR
jgi:hypothetical protein